VLEFALARNSIVEEEVEMDETAINEYARPLLDARGDQALAEAAQRAVAYEQRKENEEARTWRHIEAALKAMRGPIAS
jgi:hypothetical protein